MKELKMKSIVVLVLVAVLLMGTPLLAGGSFVIDPGSIEITAQPGTTITRTVSLFGVLQYYQKFLIEEDIDWITVEPKKGYVGPDITKELKITFKTDGLEMGKHSAKIDIWELIADEKSGVSLPIDVTLHVSDKRPEIKLIPRSLDLLPGQILQVFVVNPMPLAIELEFKPNDPWLYVNPRSLKIEPGDVEIFFVRSSSVAFTAGIWNSSIMINAIGESSGVGVHAHYPVTINVPSGVEFNPSEMNKPGSIALTNRLKRTVFVEPMPHSSADYDVDIFKLTAGERKIINVSWDAENKPLSLDFRIIGGKLDVHRINVKQDIASGPPPDKQP